MADSSFTKNGSKINAIKLPTCSISLFVNSIAIIPQSAFKPEGKLFCPFLSQTHFILLRCRCVNQGRCPSSRFQGFPSLTESVKGIEEGNLQSLMPLVMSPLGRKVISMEFTPFVEQSYMIPGYNGLSIICVCYRSISIDLTSSIYKQQLLNKLRMIVRQTPRPESC